MAVAGELEQFECRAQVAQQQKENARWESVVMLMYVFQLIYDNNENDIRAHRKKTFIFLYLHFFESLFYMCILHV